MPGAVCSQNKMWVCEAYHLTIPVALSPIANTLKERDANARAGAVTLSAGVLALRVDVRPKKLAAGLKLNKEFMKLTKSVVVDCLRSAAYLYRPTGRLLGITSSLQKPRLASGPQLKPQNCSSSSTSTSRQALRQSTERYQLFPQIVHFIASAKLSQTSTSSAPISHQITHCGTSAQHIAGCQMTCQVE